MKILEVKSIDHGSTNHVSNMIRCHLSNLCEVSSIESVKRIRGNPIATLKTVLKFKDYHILHAHLGIASKFIGRFAKKNCKVATLHGFQKAKHYRNIDFFTSVSQSVKEHFVDQGIDPSKIIVIPNGVDTKFFDIERCQSRTFTICQVGHLSKNLELSFKSLGILKKRGAKFKFLVAGDNVRPESFLPLVSQLGISENVEFLGFVHDIENVYRKSDIVIGTSFLEGFHLPILEGMASGIPAITTDSLGVRDFFNDGINGFFAKHDPEDFANKIHYFIQNSEFRQSVGRVNRNSAKDYLWSNIARKYYIFFQSILKGQVSED
jgi:glycosyltransferase involved in cell wall biosynthesis